MNGPMTYGYLIGGAVVTSLLYGPSLLRYTKERDGAGLAGRRTGEPT